MLHVHLFGRLRMLCDGRPVEFRGRPKAVPLLAYILLYRDQPISRDAVAFALWPDVPEKDARANLRRHLHHVNRELPPAAPAPPWIITDNRKIQWNPDADWWLDVAEFERLCQTDDTLERAVELYAGDLLEDIYDDWLFYDRERLRDLLFATLSRLVDLHQSRRDYPRAESYAQELLRRDPLREDAARQLMSIRYDMGNRAGALAEYEQFARRLREELAVDPMPETVTLYEQIARDRPVARPTPVSAGVEPADQPGRIPFPFVGREDEMEQLHTWWDRTAQGRGTVVFVGGEAGIGKTRLVTEFAATVESKGGRVLYGATTFTEPIPYQAVVEALKTALPLLAALNVPPLWLSAMLPVLPDFGRRRPDLAPLARLGPDQERSRLFEAIARCLAGLARPRPVLLILEDLHWASPGTVALLAFLVRQIGSHAVLILATYREEEVPRMHPLRQLRRGLQRDRLAAHQTLSRLQPQAVEDLVRQLSGLEDEAAILATALHTRSEGSPLFIQEIIHDWLSTGQVEVQNGRWRVRSLDGQSIPAGLREIVDRRVALLSEDARSLIEIIAVIGPVFDVELTREVSGWDEGDVLEALDAFLDRHLIRELGGRGRFDYAFSHQLLQATIYEAIRPVVRQRRHRRIAQVMEELYPQRLDELAGTLVTHFDRGGLAARASIYTLKAARRALAVYADAEAMAQVDRGLTLATDQRLRFDLLALRESIHHRRGRRQQQAADLAQMAQLAGEIGEDQLTCQLLSRQIDLQRALGEREQEGDLITDLKARADRLEDPWWQAEAYRLAARHAASLGQYERAQGLAEDGLARFCQLEDGEGQVKCHCLLVQIATYQGRFDDVFPLVERARALVEVQSNQVLMVDTLHTVAQAVFVRQALDESKQLSLEALALCRQIGYREKEAGLHHILGSIHGRLLITGEAFRHYERAGQLFATLGDVQGQAAVLMNQGILDVRLGRYEEGAAAFHQAGSLFDELQDLRGQTLSTLNLSAAFLRQEDYGAAKQAGERCLALARQMGSKPLEATALFNLGEAEREIGTLDDATAHMEAGLALRRSLKVQPGDLGHDLCEMTVTYLRRGDLVAAQATAGEMLDLLEADETSMIHPQQMLWVAAQTFHTLGDEDRARELLQAARARLEARAEDIADAELRHSFWQHRFNQEIVAADEQGVWPVTN